MQYRDSVQCPTCSKLRELLRDLMMVAPESQSGLPPGNYRVVDGDLVSVRPGVPPEIKKLELTILVDGVPVKS